MSTAALIPWGHKFLCPLRRGETLRKGGGFIVSFKHGGVGGGIRLVSDSGSGVSDGEGDSDGGNQGCVWGGRGRFEPWRASFPSSASSLPVPAPRPLPRPRPPSPCLGMRFCSMFRTTLHICWVRWVRRVGERRASSGAHLSCSCKRAQNSHRSRPTIKPLMLRLGPLSALGAYEL